MTPVVHAPYTGEAGRQYHQGKRGLPPAALPWVQRARAELFQPRLQAGDAVFEFGCGAGWNLAALRCARRAGHDVATFLQPGLEALGVEFIPDPGRLPDASFTVALAHHALEHLENPSATLRELHRLLAPGGRLWVAVPSDRERRHQRFNPAEPNHHLYSWTVQTLGALVAAHGFTVTHAGRRRYGYDRAAAAWAVRLHLGERGFRGLRQAARILFPLREVVVEGRRPG